MMGRLLCWFGFHDWGRQENIQEFVLPLFPFFGWARCKRKCLRCGLVKEFTYDHRR